MNVLEIINEPGPLQEVMKWLWEDESYRGGGWHFKDEKIKEHWPRFWKAIDVWLPNVKRVFKETIEECDAVFVSKTGNELWFGFSKLTSSKSDPKISVGRTKATLKVKKNLDVEIRRG